MTHSQLTRLVAIFAQLSQARSTEPVSVWTERHVVFNEPKCKGPFSLAGREYLAEPLDNFAVDEVTDQVCCMATRTGKTRIFYGGMAWLICNEPSRMLFVKPKTNGAAGARDDARTRFIPMIRATALLAAKIPGGQQRFDFNTAQQIISGSIIDWAGSNSVGALASNPCNCVLQDEVDKFNSTHRRDEDGNEVEADASDLADERAKEFSNPKRFKASTPTLTQGRIWQELLKSDFRRYFMPCPHCGKDVVFAWSKDYTVIDKSGCEAYVRWDDAAKGSDGKWDLDKVEATAHAECPHCQGHILDAHKAAMVRAGHWVATRKSNRRGYHLPAMYSAHRECNFGRMARRFIEAVKSLKGPQNFINSDLAEPFAMQGVDMQKVEQVKRIEVGAEWKKIQTVDVQQKAPFFWFIIRAYGGREIVGLKGGPLETWDDVRAVQTAEQVKDVAVIVDSGYGARDDAEVYRTCAGYGEKVPGHGCIYHIGWTPAKGMDGNFQRRDPKTGLYVPWYSRPIDPYLGTLDAGKVKLDVFEFARDFFNDVLERLRHNKSEFHWTISPELDNDTYHQHMRGQVKRMVVKYGREVAKWQKRYTHAPDHLRSCEIMQVAAASAFELLDVNEQQKENESCEQPSKSEAAPSN